jgi:hypothetical protein
LGYKQNYNRFNGLNYQGNDDTYTVEYNTDGQSVNIVYSDATKGWIPLEDDVTAEAPSPPPTQKAIFGYGNYWFKCFNN